MAVVRPFRAILPNPQVLDLDDFLFNPNSESGFKHLAHPTGNKDDRSKFVKYAQSTNKLHSNLNNGHFVKAEKPAYYVIQNQTQRWLLALVEINDQVKSLEETPTRVATERSWLTEASATQFEFIHTYIPNDITLANAADPILIPKTSRCAFELHSLPIEFNPLIEASLASQQAYLVHGTETLPGITDYFEAKRKRRPSNPAGHFMALIPLQLKHPAIQFRPISVSQSELGPINIQSQIGEHFALTPYSKEEMMSKLASTELKTKAGIFGVTLPEGYSFVAQAKDIEQLANEIGANPKHLANSQVLHRFVFEKLFGLTGKDVFSYAKEAGEDSRSASGQLQFFVGDEDLEDLENLAISTGVFPPRSVDVSVAPPQGMAMWSLLDLQA